MAKNPNSSGGLPGEGETGPLTQAKFEAWRTGLLQNWGYSPEDAKLRLQGSWRPASAQEPAQDRAAPPEAAAELARPELEAQPGETPLTMRPIWAITTLSTILKSSTGKAGKTGKSRNSRPRTRRNGAKSYAICSTE